MGNQQVSLELIPIPEMDKYFVDKSGKIYSTNRGTLKEMTCYEHFGRSKNPYLRVKMRGKLYLAYRIIMSVIIGRELLSSEFVNHKNGNTTDNSIDNLEVVSHKENVAHAVANNLYQSGEEWYKSRKLQRPERNCS